MRILILCSLLLSLAVPCTSAKDAPGTAVEKTSGNPPTQTPSGTKPAVPGDKPAEPGLPAEKPEPVKPADTAQPEKGAPEKSGQPPDETPSGTKPADPATPGEEPATPAEPGAKDKAEKEKRDKPARHKPNRSGKSSGSGLPSGAVPPAVGAGALGALPAGLGKDKKDEAAKEPAKEVSSATVVSTPTAPAAEPYSQGENPALVVLDFEGEKGAELADLLAEALKPGRRVYSRATLALKNYGQAVNRVSAKKIAAETGADYLIAGKISKKTETLYIVAVILRDSASGDIQGSNFVKMKDLGGLAAGAADAAKVVSAELEKFKR
jgi:TolB-like protein